MVNLLKEEYKKTKFIKSKEDEDKNEEQNKPGSGENSDATEKPIGKIDPKKYKDPEGMTIPKLEAGYWFIKNKPLFYKIFLGFLFIIGLLTFPRFVWTYGHYIIFGMRQDKELALELTDQSNDLHGIVMQQAAKNLVPSSLIKLKNHDGTYDFLIKIKNPNVKHWGNFEYFFTNGSEEFGQAQSFIYPGEEKYIVSLAVDESNIGSNINFVVGTANWSRITAHTIADWEAYRSDRYQINVRDIEFTPARATILTEKLSLNELKFSVDNNSAFNYYECGFLIILYGQNEPIATTYVTIDNFMSGDEQDIAITIPGFFSRVSDIDIFPDLDIYNPGNFIRFEGGVGEVK